MAANLPLVERVDIHKSCKALESIVNVFNDYCQAAEALALEQKKLARVLKDAVGLKATNELAGNALNAAATLLESLAEVDSKFVKTVDKECEGASSDVKKWFKKLAKEERNHDDRISAANTKIKQAGQAYEKKAKKKDHDAGEEHTRYVNLLSIVGPEMSQEKYNHSLFVTQRHTATLYNVASSISRAADAEWARACDCVRKFAPVIGRIGECRAYLEGGWMLGLPDASSGIDDRNDGGAEVANSKVDEMGVRVAKAASGSTETDSSAHRSTAPAYTPSTSFSLSTSLSSTSSYQTPYSPPLAPPSLPSRSHSVAAPPMPYFPAPLERLNTDSVRSIESLSSFPTPPTHFPLPAMNHLPSSPLAQTSTDLLRPSDGDGVKATSVKPGAVPGSNGTANQPTPIPDAPKPLTMPVEQTAPALTDDDGRSPMTGQSASSTSLASPNAGGHDLDKREAAKVKLTERPQSPGRLTCDSVPRGASEFGMQDRKISGTIERAESITSTSSIVASMRDKWGRGDVPTTAPPRERDIPRVPNKVADLASRYIPTTDANAAPLSPRDTGQTSPTSDRLRQVSGQSTLRDGIPTAGEDHRGTAALANPGPTASEINFARRRRRIEELEDLDRREQAQALRAREREIETRTKELERERDRLRALGTTPPSGLGAAAVRAHSQHSYSMVNLIPSRSSGGEVPARPVSQHGEPLALSASPSTSSSTSNPSSRPDHAPYCGCQACSASQYSNVQSHVQIVTQPRLQKDKPKGWMRRLSMPVVGNAFSSSDSKKVYGIGAGIAGGGQTGGSLPHFEQDNTGGISNVNNARPRKISFGRR